MATCWLSMSLTSTVDETASQQMQWRSPFCVFSELTGGILPICESIHYKTNLRLTCYPGASVFHHFTAGEAASTIIRSIIVQQQPFEKSIPLEREVNR